METNRSVYIVGGGSLYRDMFKEMGWSIEDSIHDADFIQFVGGADVDPSFYDASPHPRTKSNIERDHEERLIFNKYLHNKVMLGICRGAQFLNVMNGGILWQHVDGHAIAGTHPALNLMTGEVVEVTSTHHQMMIPAVEGSVLCVASESFNREDDDTRELYRRYDDPEVVYYDMSRSLCFQPHPEHKGAEECCELYFNLIEELFFNES